MLTKVCLLVFTLISVTSIQVPISPTKSVEFDLNQPNWLFRFGSYFSSWNNHAVFARWLTLYKRPELIVDLGVDLGYSTLTWSESLREANIATGKVIGIDSFDFHFVLDDPTVSRNTYSFVMQLVDHFKGKFTNMELIKGYFEEVSQRWRHGSTVDILHVDGRHEYEHVKSDYYAWQQHVRPDGVVLFHDCYVWNQEHFGVYRFFDEISEYKFRGYFENDYGLGVATNDDVLFTAIAMQFPNFRIGSRIEVPTYALPSYHIKKATNSVQKRLLVDVTGVEATKVISVFISMGEAMSSEVTASVLAPWGKFVADLTSSVRSATRVSGVPVLSDELPAMVCREYRVQFAHTC